MRTGLRFRQGMSLVEGVVALAILSMSFLGALQILIVVQGLDARTSSRALAIDLVQQRIEELKAMAAGYVPGITYDTMDIGPPTQRQDETPPSRRVPIYDDAANNYQVAHPLSRIGCEGLSPGPELNRCRDRYRGFLMNTQIQRCNGSQSAPPCGDGTNPYAEHKVFTVWVFYQRPEGGGEENVLLTTYAARK